MPLPCSWRVQRGKVGAVAKWESSTLAYCSHAASLSLLLCIITTFVLHHHHHCVSLGGSLQAVQVFLVHLVHLEQRELLISLGLGSSYCFLEIALLLRLSKLYRHRCTDSWLVDSGFLYPLGLLQSSYRCVFCSYLPDFFGLLVYRIIVLVFLVQIGFEFRLTWGEVFVFSCTTWRHIGTLVGWDRLCVSDKGLLILFPDIRSFSHTDL